MQAIVYALGVEGCLGPSHSIPLTPAVTRAIEIDGQEIPVLESNVYVSISNRNGKQLTIKRPVKSAASPKLVTVWPGNLEQALSGTLEHQEFFLRMEGAASREHGFHLFLEQFIGWSLPDVARFDGSTSKLYLEALFPLLYVEQKRGWAAIQANQPTYLGIKESAKRAFEFLLSLDAFYVQTKKQQLHDQLAALRTEWRSTVNHGDDFVRMVAGELVNISRDPTIQWPPEIPPGIRVIRDGKAVAISDAVLATKTRLQSAENRPVQNVGVAQSGLQEKLGGALKELSEREQLANLVLRDIRDEEIQFVATDKRLADLRDDRKRYLDIQRLRNLGSASELSVLHNQCPTCHQSIEDSLLPQVQARRPFGVDESIEMIDAQLEALSTIRDASHAAQSFKRAQLQDLQISIGSVRDLVRSIRSDLIAPNQQPTESAIKEKLLLQQEIDRFNTAQEQFGALLNKLEDLSKLHRKLSDELARIPPDGLTDLDKKKLSELRIRFLAYESQYKFSSFDPKLLDISSETYRPTREGYDIGFEASASDNIRIIWGYLLSLLTTSAKFNTNHPGLLLLDEPRQQEARMESFSEFLKVAAQAAEMGSQVVVATSEEKQSLEQALKGLRVNYINFDTRILASAI